MKLGQSVRALLDASISGRIDMVETHPDGLPIFCVNDHWFPARYLVAN